jgi:hypothetical protein
MALLEPVQTRRAVGGQLIFFLLWLAVTGVAIYLTPSTQGHGTHQQLGLPPCPSVLIFDRPCPGCGLTTSWTAMVHGQVGLAFRAHSLGPVTYGLFTASAFVAAFGFLSRRRIVTEGRILNWAIGIFAVGFLAFGVLRMLTTPGYASAHERAIAPPQPFAEAP